MERSRKRLYLCAGLQSSGSTLVSWCFLQRGDMDGVLDGPNDMLPQIDSALARPYAWYKTTISCFRLSELAWHYAAGGWDVRPILVARDVRAVWGSLLSKPYASNGITAEDPPLRLRFYRFQQDWEHARQAGWPVLRYESLVESPERTLQALCRQLDLPWDEAMVRWPKSEHEITHTDWGNETFWKTRGPDLVQTIASHRQRRRPLVLPADDLQWLEREFRRFNSVSGYPSAMPAAAGRGAGGSAPTFEATRRYQWETQRKPIRWLFARLGIPYRKLIERHSIKRAA